MDKAGAGLLVKKYKNWQICNKKHTLRFLSFNLVKYPLEVNNNTFKKVTFLSLQKSLKLTRIE